MPVWRLVIHARGIKPGSPHGARVGDTHPHGVYVTADVAARRPEIAQRDTVRRVRSDLLARGLSPGSVIIEDTRKLGLFAGLFRRSPRYEFYDHAEPVQSDQGISEPS